MGLLTWAHRAWLRGTYLDRSDNDTARALEASSLAEAAPAIADAIRGLANVVTASTYDAVEAAYDSLKPTCEKSLESASEAFAQQHKDQCDRINLLTSRCRDEVELTRRSQTEQAKQLSGLRNLYAEQQDLTRRFAEGYDWQVIKEYCFRFIRILDSLDEQLQVLREDATEAHVRDVQNAYNEIQFALEASGVEQFRPGEGEAFTGNEKRLKVVSEIPTDDGDVVGRVATVRMPGYLLAREGQDDRILRPAHVEVFATSESQQQEELRLQESQS